MAETATPTRPRRMRSWLRRRVWTGIAALSAAGAFSAQILAAANLPTSARVVLVVGGSLAAAIALLLPIRQADRAELEREDANRLATKAVAAYKLALQDVLLPLTYVFDRVINASSSKSRAEAEGSAKQAIVDYVVTLAGFPRTRACYFEYKKSDSDEKLVTKYYAGRQDKPRQSFRKSENRHSQVFELLLERQSEFRPDIEHDPPPSVPEGRQYKGYISVPVATSDQIFGLLTVDTVEPNCLTPFHEQELRLLAQLLALVLGSAVKQGATDQDHGAVQELERREANQWRAGGRLRERRS